MGRVDLVPRQERISSRPLDQASETDKGVFLDGGGERRRTTLRVLPAHGSTQPRELEWLIFETLN